MSTKTSQFRRVSGVNAVNLALVVRLAETDDYLLNEPSLPALLADIANRIGVAEGSDATALTAAELLVHEPADIARALKIAMSRAGIGAGQIAARIPIHRSQVYLLSNPARNSLPRTPEQLRSCLAVCRLPQPQIDLLSTQWMLLHQRRKKNLSLTLPRLRSVSPEPAPEAEPAPQPEPAKARITPAANTVLGEPTSFSVRDYLVKTVLTTVVLGLLVAMFCTLWLVNANRPGSGEVDPTVLMICGGGLMFAVKWAVPAMRKLSEQGESLVLRHPPMRHRVRSSAVETCLSAEDDTVTIDEVNGVYRAAPEPTSVTS